MGEPMNSLQLDHRFDSLLSKQRPSEGWGEGFASSFNRVHSEYGTEAFGGEDGSDVTSPSWALLGLSAAQRRDYEAIKTDVPIFVAFRWDFWYIQQI